MTQSGESDSDGAAVIGITSVGNYIGFGTITWQCPICHEWIDPGVTHRHDGPLSSLDKSDS